VEELMDSLLATLGLENENGGVGGFASCECTGATLVSTSPIDGAEIASIRTASENDYGRVIVAAQEAFEKWRTVPAPVRGQIVREIGDALREKKTELGKLVTLEMGKILAEGEGEIQECIDIADFAVGLSRQLYGKTMHSERPSHRMYEQWHPLGTVGVITAFNFPAAVWAWNAMIAAVCGDVVVWKPSEHTPLIALAMNKIADEIATRHGHPGVFQVIIGDGPLFGERLAEDVRVPLVSATGSCRMGRSVARAVASRLGKVILELGGNNAIIVDEDADLSLVVPSVVFGAVGTAGQRCTTTRRLLIHENIYDEVVSKLRHAYEQVIPGNPLDERVLMGPLVNEASVASYSSALEQIKEQGGQVLYGGEVLSEMPSNLYVLPTLVKASHDMPIVKEETFAPILYLIPVKSFDEAMVFHNDVPQGLSSAVFTNSLKTAERFLCAAGSDCGIANVNIGTSGAEIGGAFGGEKDTGGGRESGSDSWKQYMRRQTNTINYSNDLPLAQGIRFDLDT
jgi:aldehyde dehydrogenase (NAD+)